MAYCKVQPGFTSKFLKFGFPKAISSSSAVHSEQELISGRILFTPHFVPPGADRIYRELGCIRADTGTDKALVCDSVIHSMWRSFPWFRQRNVMVQRF